MHPGFVWIGKSLDGNTVTLNKFQGKFNLASYVSKDWRDQNSDLIRRAAFVDTETTGLNQKSDKIIELAVRLVEFNKATGELLSILDSYSELQDPGAPLSETVQRITGLTDAMVAGKTIDWNHADSLLSKADIIIAHNAGFDRPFIDAKSKATQTKPWGCSLKQLDWNSKGFNTAKLEFLAIYHGYFTDAHRALNDVDSLIHLLSHQDWITRRPYLNELLSNARKPIIRILAFGSPFESKDILKERGYSWDPNSKVWGRTIYKETSTDEMAWLENAVYKGNFKGSIQEISLTDQFKS